MPVSRPDQVPAAPLPFDVGHGCHTSFEEEWISTSDGPSS